MFKSRRFFVHLLVIFMAFSVSSCFHIVEEIFFKKDGSGTYSFTFDMSKVADMMEMMGGNNDEMDASLSEMYTEFEKVKARLEAINGISNANQDIDKKKMILTTTFDFDNINALNRGMSEFFKDQNAANPNTAAYFTYSKGKLIRTDRDDLSSALTDTMTEGEETPDFDPAIMFADVYFESVLKFERGHKGFSNDDYTALDKNTIKWKKFLFNPKEKNKSVGNSISTKF